MEEELTFGFQKQISLLKQKNMEAKEREGKLSEEENVCRQTKKDLQLKSQKLDEEQAKLDQEKESMKKGEAFSDDVIELNVQGTIFCTSRHTLTQIPETRMAYFFNGRHDEKLSRDSQNRVFFDIIPSQFKKILDYLTAKRSFKKDEGVPIPPLEGEHAAYFQNLVRYFGLEKELYGGPRNFSRILKSPSIMLNDEASSAKLAVNGAAYVLSEGVYENSITEFTLIIKSIDVNFPKMFIGIMAKTLDPIQDNSFNGNEHSYGFSDCGHKWYAGKKLEEEGNPGHAFCNGMEIKLILCCKSDENYLAMKIDDSEESLYIRDLPVEQKWRLHVNMVGKGDEISLLNIRDIEQLNEQ